MTRSLNPFRRSPSAPPSGPPGSARAAELERTLDSIHPDGTSDRPLAIEDVTGVLGMALERVRQAVEQTHVALGGATERFELETEAMRATTRRLTDPPKESR